MHEPLGDREKADVMFMLEMRAERRNSVQTALEELRRARGVCGRAGALLGLVRSWVRAQAERVIAD